ncbi:hypothetical protein C8Q80DRAFT_1269350 [Daedaleopsis nitida]|nr:hypothetical protein C8Q80DRAFT_1269350 [Daedaleopsis nitida]
MAQHQHPQHPQFLDVDWPRNHDRIPAQPLQLENEYDIDPTRYDILQGDLTSTMDRPRPQQTTGFPMNNNFGREQFGGADDYMFTFPNPQAQSQHFNQIYSGGQFLPDQTPQYSGLAFGDGSQNLPSSPYYSDDNSAYAYNQGQALPMGQHARTGSNHPAPARTPTVRTFQGERTHFYSTPVTPNYGSSPSQSMGMYQGHQPEGSNGLHAAKRMRALDDGDGETSSADGDAHEEGGQAKGDSAKPPKPPGACARCKGLKVKCEFKTDPDVCKRCLNGGHECVIPGRKKRRAPPRRDLLLGQIREQATKIEELMKQLEEANKRANLKQSDTNAPSPSQSASNTDPSNISELSTSEIGTPEPATNHITKPDVLDWIAKARESIEAFGGYINMGGTGATKDLLSGGDLLGWKDSSSESEDAEGDSEEDGYKSDLHVEVRDVDAKQAEVQRGRARPEGPPANEASTSQAKSDATSSSRRTSRRPKSATREKLAILPVDATPIGLLANMSLKKKPRSRKSSRSPSVSTTEDNEYGMANEDYFRASSPSPDRSVMYAQHQAPYILRSGLVSPAEVEKLFKIYFDYMNPSVSILDPVLYTAQRTYWRSPLLFTTICGIASRYYGERPELYQQAMTCARLAGGSTLIGGQKSVETVAAYLLLALWPVPARKWEEDRAFVYLGLAIRIATDINLHHMATVEHHNEQHAREVLNRTRIWLCCYVHDRAFSSQYGKAPIISNTDYVANHTEFWYKSSPYNMSDDIHLCARRAVMRALADYRGVIFSNPEHPAGLSVNVDVTTVSSETDDTLARLWETWSTRFREEKRDTESFEFRTSFMKVLFSYSRMAVLSFAFQHLGQDGSHSVNDTMLWRCLRAAKDLIRTVLDEIATPRLRTFMRYASDSQCVLLTFTCAFLLKLLHPRYVPYIPRDTRVELRTMVEDTANFLGSPDIGIDDRHAPKMYSRFLHGLLDSPHANVDYSPTALKRATRSLATSPADSTSDRPSASPVMPAPVASVSPATHVAARSEGTADAQMFDGLGLEYVEQLSPVDGAGLYAPPLPFDPELLQSMQSLTDSTWSSMVLPGFSWMDSMQQDQDVQM